MKSPPKRYYRIKDSGIFKNKSYEKIPLTQNEIILKRIVFTGFKIWELKNYLKYNPHDSKANEILNKYILKEISLENSFINEFAPFNDNL